MAKEIYPTQENFSGSSGDVSFSFNSSTGEVTSTDERKLKSRKVDLNGNTGIDLSSEDGVASDIYTIQNTGSSIPSANVILPPSSVDGDRAVIVQNTVDAPVNVGPSSFVIGLGTEGQDYVQIPSNESLTTDVGGSSLVFGRTSFPVPPSDVVWGNTEFDDDYPPGAVEITSISDGQRFVIDYDGVAESGIVRSILEIQPASGLGDGQRFTIENRSENTVVFAETGGRSPEVAISPEGVAEFEMRNDDVHVLPGGDTYDTSYEVVADGTVARGQITRTSLHGKYVVSYCNISPEDFSIFNLETESYDLLIKDITAKTDVDIIDKVVHVRDTQFYFTDPSGGGRILEANLDNINPSTGEPYLNVIYAPDPPDTIDTLDYYVKSDGTEVLFFWRSDGELFRFEIQSQTLTKAVDLEDDLALDRWVGFASPGTIIDSARGKMYCKFDAIYDSSIDDDVIQFATIDLETETIDYFRRWPVDDATLGHPYTGIFNQEVGGFSLDFKKFNPYTITIDSDYIQRDKVGSPDDNPEDVFTNIEGRVQGVVHFETSTGRWGRYVYDFNDSRIYWYGLRNRGERPTGETAQLLGKYNGDLYFAREGENFEERQILRVNGFPPRK